MGRFLFIATLLCCSCLAGGAQTTQMNLKDEQGRPHGQWVINQPARMGEEGYAEWGTYDHGVKWGMWYKFDNDARVTAIERYRNGVLDGEANYFEHGRLTAAGNYRGLNPAHQFDTFFVVDPVTDEETRRIIPTERGTVKQGVWRFYDPQTGRLTLELDYQLDEVVDRKEFAIAATDSAWYRKREEAMPHNQRKYYKPPRDKQIRYTDFH